jgi:hypothetical protein
MGQMFGMYGGEEKKHAGFQQGNLNERPCLEDLCIDGRIISKCILNGNRGNGVYGGVEGAGWRVDMTWQEP